ncbi:uncharacterized protein LOC135165183 isoform X2 [Diachasmimorpha longicaudata]|uniref:uncharacterized protein LOC135165183 isoform X2 n=1 Tax=Diachasmimorpha longicaudata TaxID=58733 RepID=UPI0030B8953C
MIEYVANVNGGTFESAEDVIKILHPILRFGGLWPLDPPGFRYLFFLVPYIITKFFGFLDLIDVFGKLELTIENIAEETLVIVTVSRLLWVKFSPLLPNLISTVRDGMRAENFDSDEERRLYLEYNVTTKVVVKFVIAMGMAGTIAYHVRPLIFRMLASVQGQTNISYVLPYRAQVFFDYQDPRLYSLVYFLQSITIFIHFFVTATIGLLFMLCFHCCGELSALQHRIKAISFEAKNERHSPEFIVKDFVERHMKIIEIAKNIDKASQVVLLEELATMTIILALSSYCAMLVDKRWCTSTLSIIYAYCYIGEALITEVFARDEISLIFISVLGPYAEIKMTVMTTSSTIHYWNRKKIINCSLVILRKLPTLTNTHYQLPLLRVRIDHDDTMVMDSPLRRLHLYCLFDTIFRVDPTLEVCLQSDNVHQAYYTSRWYDFSEEYKKSLTICMVGSSRPLLLTAGGFYTYSKVSFTAILKSAAAYLSMLRNLAES